MEQTTNSDSLQKGRPLSETDKAFLEGYALEIIDQSNRMDALARQLIALELAIPGIFLAVLRFISPVLLSPHEKLAYPAAFAAWAFSLICTCAALFPRNYRVDETLFAHTPFPKKTPDIMGIEEFFFFSARYKRRWLVLSCAAVCLGILLATLPLFFNAFPNLL